jgi:O-antigen/teichoic acid export membrane protein
MSNSKLRSSKDIMIYAIGTVIRQLVGFIMLPIYTRYLSPADYGIIALLALSIAIFELILGARFVQVLPKFYFDESESKARKVIISTALTVTALLSICGVIIIWLNTDVITYYLLGNLEYSNYIFIYAILLFTVGIELYGMMYLRLLEMPIVFVLSSIAKLIVQLSLNIYLVVILEKGVMGVVISSVTSSILFCVIYMILIYGQCGFSFNFPLVKRLFIYTWPLWVAGGATLYIHSSNRYFIRIYSNLDDVGLFELAAKFAFILTAFVWKPFSQWWQTERFKLLKISTNIKKDFQIVFDLLIAVMATASVLIVIFSGPTITIMSTSTYHDAIQAVMPLTYSLLFFNLSMFFNLGFLA